MSPEKSLLLTDLYELTMMQGYHYHRMEGLATFELFVRKLPKNRNFLVFAGLEQLLSFVEEARFEEEEIHWLAQQGFKKDFLDYLKNFRFQGDIYAMAEGTIFFPFEPVLRITAPIAQAQILESRLMNIIHYQTLIASKAIRFYLVAAEKKLVEFGLRRAHGSEASLFAARASFIAGFSATSNVLAGKMFSIPVTGTMAHSFVQAHDVEELAFYNYAVANPRNVTLLIDTYDTERAAKHILSLAPRLREKGITIEAVRLDSGDLDYLSRSVRSILDSGGLKETKIFVSGSLDEYKLEELVKSGAPIDGFGIGTSLDTSSDCPYLDCVYKLQEYEGKPRRKRSTGKATWPGSKQLFRYFNDSGIMQKDLICLAEENYPAVALLQPVMRQGKRILPKEDLGEIQRRTLRSLGNLPPRLKTLQPAQTLYPVEFSPSLVNLKDKLEREEIQG
ncbi:nicotinate phosphoribosyltransferase [Candidatus Methylacidiphilum infernorum]|uniref:Nicotinate phosphoribosyltransferase n=1 Tax=Candidatus Methylacidiphilum infernorum TaxID=511746 RepID=A0ABX7PVE3_9BACT|nr:nicotinate phosphoribosyltransferase [Candidatus Methylacidiphilum infernorum]QSR86626.1 nicotinate phosphoribosyltransferase [Candidatus Methylacidiphilum infernorum]